MKIDFRADYFTEDSSSPIDDETKRYFIRNLEYIVNKLIENLKLPSNCSIVIPNSFGEDLYKFQSDKGLNQEYTDSSMGTAFAKVLDYIEDSKSNTAIFINKALVFSLYSDEDIENMTEEQKEMIIPCRDIAINTIHHELIHLHDEEVAGDKYNKFKSDCGKDLMSNMKDIAIMVWREYYACRLSATTYNWEKIDEDFENLIKQINYVYKTTEENVFEYRMSGDLDALIDRVGSMIPTLLNYAAYELGRLSYYKKESFKGDLRYLDERLINTFFYKTWIGMNEHLDELFDIYPYLELNSFNNLSNTILKCWNSLGIYPKDSENGMYISIPI